MANPCARARAHTHTRTQHTHTRTHALALAHAHAPLFLGRFEHWNELGEVQADDEFVQQNVCGPVIIASTKRTSTNAKRSSTS